MQTKIENHANLLWQKYDPDHPKFWRKYEHLIRVAKRKGAQCIKPDYTLDSGTSSDYTLCKIVEPMTTWVEKIEFSFGLGFAVLLMSSVIAAFIAAIIGTTVLGYVIVDLIVFVILFGYGMYDTFSNKAKTPEILEKCVLNLASTYFMITNDEGVKKVHFKFIQSIQYIEHHLVVKADYPNHGQYEYEIPLYDGKGRKLSSPQIKQLYQALDLGRQNNR